MILFKLYFATYLSLLLRILEVLWFQKKKQTFEKPNFVRFALKKKYCKCLNVWKVFSRKISLWRTFKKSNFFLVQCLDEHEMYFLAKENLAIFKKKKLIEIK